MRLSSLNFGQRAPKDASFLPQGAHWLFNVMDGR